MSKNVLVTGANGQLGQEIQAIAIDYDMNFFFTDVEDLDLTQAEDVRLFIENKDIDLVINCAAYTAVDKAEDEPEVAYKVNAEAVKNLAEAVFGKACLIHISTDYVFSGKQTNPIKETEQLDPQSVYGRSKLAGELALQAACPNSIIIRTAWLYSVYGNNFVKTILRLGAERDSLNVVCDQLGTPTYASDLARAIMTMVSEREFVPGIYHYSNEGEANWFDFAQAIVKNAGLTCVINPVSTSEYPTKATRPSYSILDKTKIKETFHITIPQWEESLIKCIDLLKAN
ncbi:dTDP-4-dehydrorhamnose reductase [Bacteroidales bacterium OttesenSCG-928-M11]|nr:dTDP-4-dehydrorhamnose reductase [Bacteroidales bacterium OttesenSCG-928-M11]